MLLYLQKLDTNLENNDAQVLDDSDLDEVAGGMGGRGHFGGGLGSIRSRHSKGNDGTQKGGPMPKVSGGTQKTDDKMQKGGRMPKVDSHAQKGLYTVKTGNERL